MGRGVEEIDHDDLVATIDQLIDDGGADESRATGNEDAHPAHQFVAISAVIEMAVNACSASQPCAARRRGPQGSADREAPRS